MAFLQIIFFFLLFTLSSSLFPSSAFSLTVKDVPNPKSTVNLFVQDSAQVLDENALFAIQQISETLQNKTSIEMAVVTIDNLEGLSIEDYAEQLFNLWGIGKKDKDNGVLILFSLQDRKVRIEVGYGLEAILTDSRSKRIIENQGIPYFKEKKYATGLYQMSFSTAEFLSKSMNINLDLAHLDSILEKDNLVTSNPNLDRESTSLKGLSQKTYTRVFFFMIGISLVFSPLIYVIVRRTSSLAGKKKYFERISIIYVASSFLFGLALFIYSIYLLSSSESSGWDVLGSIFAPVLGGFLGAVFFGKVSKKIQKHIDHYRLKCASCNSRMNIIGEGTDDKFLIPEEIAEENAGGMDYEFWSCPQCHQQTSFRVKLGGARHCQQCHRRSLKTTRKTIQSPTTSSSGLAIVTYQCYNKACAYFHEKQVVLPKLASSSSGGSGSGSSSGSSFGGGSSGGGGASGSW